MDAGERGSVRVRYLAVEMAISHRDGN